jgi:hypothetical protein
MVETCICVDFNGSEFHAGTFLTANDLPGGKYL